MYPKRDLLITPFSQQLEVIDSTILQNAINSSSSNYRNHYYNDNKVALATIAATAMAKQQQHQDHQSYGNGYQNRQVYSPYGQYQSNGSQTQTMTTHPQSQSQGQTHQSQSYQYHNQYTSQNQTGSLAQGLVQQPGSQSHSHNSQYSQYNGNSTDYSYGQYYSYGQTQTPAVTSQISNHMTQSTQQYQGTPQVSQQYQGAPQTTQFQGTSNVINNQMNSSDQLPASNILLSNPFPSASPSSVPIQSSNSFPLTNSNPNSNSNSNPSSTPSIQPPNEPTQSNLSQSQGRPFNTFPSPQLTAMNQPKLYDSDLNISNHSLPSSLKYPIELNQVKWDWNEKSIWNNTDEKNSVDKNIW